MQSHLLTDGSKLLKSFKKLPRSPRSPSGKVSNIWHFDLRYVHLDPPSHVLFLFQPGSSYVYQKMIPCEDNTPGSGVLFFPENAKDAAPEIVKALMYAFAHGLDSDLDKKMMGNTDVPPAFAPWKLSTESKDIGEMVGKEFKRLGVAQELHTISISSAKTIRDAHEAFVDLFLSVITSFGIAANSVPHSIQYRASDVPAADGSDRDPEQQELAYCMSIQNSKPPKPESERGSVSVGEETMKTVEITMKLLEARPNALVKAEAEAGDSLAALDYGVRLLHGVRCAPDRSGARAYLIQAATSSAATAETKSMAHALLIGWYIDHFRGSDRPITARYLFAAAHHANESARIIRPVLRKGSAAAPLVLVSVPLFEKFCEKLPELEYLCREVFLANEARQEQMRKADEKMAVKRMDQPNRYRCANPGCGIEADAGDALKQCSGACDRDKKPSYCSKECQRADWKNHKPFCRAGAPCSVIDPSFSTSAFSRRAPSGAIKLQMGSTAFSSSTMSPEFMKEMKEYIEGKGDER